MLRGGLRTFLQRGTMYVLSIVVVAVVFFSIEFIVERSMFNNDEVVDILTAAVGAFAFSKVRVFFERVTDKAFFRGAYDYEGAVLRLGIVLGSSIDLRVLLRKVCDFICSTIKPDFVDVFLEDGAAPLGFAAAFSDPDPSGDAAKRMVLVSVAKDLSGGPLFIEDAVRTAPKFPRPASRLSNVKAQARSLGVAAIVPIVSQEGVNSVFLIGQKRSGEPLSSRDRALLAVISGQAGIAIHNAKLHETIRGHATELAHRVNERTKRMREMYEAQSKFVVEISHELQTPIAILRMNLDRCMVSEGAEARKARRIMEATLERLSRLTQGLLGLARLNFSKDRLERRRVDVSRLLRGARDDCLVLAEDKGISLSLSGERIFVQGDADKLKEVFLNLLSNAMKHTLPGGSIRMQVRSTGRRAEIIVSDTGSGIKARDMPHIFERFYRVDADVSAKTEQGTGLGLYLCKRIIEAHNGTITAESKVGRGSRFVVSLPLWERG